jgi:hypothetical protein
VGADRDLIDRYERFADLCEDGSVAATAGDVTALQSIDAACVALRATLPEQAPAAARPALERAAIAHELLTHALSVGMAEARAGLSRLQRNGAQVQAYGGTVQRLVDASS